jgi:hypothetical protein
MEPGRWGQLLYLTRTRMEKFYFYELCTIMNCLLVVIHNLDKESSKRNHRKVLDPYNTICYIINVKHIIVLAD